MKDLLNVGQILGREEMKKLMAGSGSGCGPSCSGCQKDNSSHGPCVEWKCLDGGWCYPESNDCCIVV
jgi:hypothetical protein